MRAAVIGRTECTLWNSVPERSYYCYDVVGEDGKLYSVSEFNMVNGKGHRSAANAGDQGDLVELTITGRDYKFRLDQ